MEPGSSSSASRARKGWILLGYNWGGVCSEPQIPTQLDASSWIPLCSAHSPAELLQGACAKPQGVGHGAPARPGCHCHSSGDTGTLRGTQDSRGEVAPGRTEQLMVPKPSHGGTAEGTRGYCRGRTGPGAPRLSGLSKHGVVGGKSPGGPCFQQDQHSQPHPGPFPALVMSWPRPEPIPD